MKRQGETDEQDPDVEFKKPRLDEEDPVIKDDPDWDDMEVKLEYNDVEVQNGGENEGFSDEEDTKDGIIEKMEDIEASDHQEAGEIGAAGELEPQTDMGLRYKVQLSNIYKFSSRGDVEAFCKKNGIVNVKVKKIPKVDNALLTFMSEAEMNVALRVLDGKIMKGKSVSLNVLALNVPQRKEKPTRNDRSESDDRTPSERLADQVTPLWRKPYEEQLAIKSTELQRVLGRKGLVSELYAIQNLREDQRRDLAWLESGTEYTGGVPCPFRDIIPSPITENYRTKCEFSIGRDLSGELTVGFLLGGFRSGEMIVMDPSETKHVSKPALVFARIMQDHVRASEYPPYDRKLKSGVWRLLVSKTFLSGENMMVVQIDPRSLTEEQIAQEKIALQERFAAGAAAAKLNLTSLMYQEWTGVFDGFSDKAPLTLLAGEPHVHEVLCGIKFRVSPFAFFQINTPATEILYGIVKDWCGLSAGVRDTVVLDLCCGTGTIGLTLAKLARRVIGVEMVKQAIADAKENARANEIWNVDYICGKVEQVIPQVIKRVTREMKVVAVLDPPREGVHASVIEAIRACTELRHIVYVACNAAAAVQNFVALCRPTSNKYKGRPFKMTRAQPIDMFPHSKPVELVLEFRRDPPASAPAVADPTAAMGSVASVGANPAAPEGGSNPLAA
ncbi:S-adenosyl-L-methionine-dependent methyltransferase [Gonapodya prolifera JEL478]|uniref:S-adenosyl-L-methionine-dependent methyltransferase n=1 Tax=Gonapodya prolifera (strain JEL478) TaxID=1344416 RepID=A0A139AVG8_GONPJ|nr:S-adenosyl-L-methionine-dependent methyltransferase [Gonapodya prolifera JEL478]|eukprot:KXS20699.1 S-adenosyl-L-methionine-dependent methyltransferase [Gonapodya prolifera JEL478]